ncbi:hypothetical protein SCANM63S_07243 [Streptomyces canarius]
MDADSTDATLYARLRTDVVHRLAGHPAFKGVTGADDPWRSAAYPALFRPWLAAVPRIGYALESLLSAGLVPYGGPVGAGRGLGRGGRGGGR